MKALMCNLKANKTLAEFNEYIEKINKIPEKDSLVIFPTHVFLGIVNKYNISFGSQDISIYNEGSSTGEVTAKQVKSTNAAYTIIGHSERREKYKEDEYVLSKKIRNALDNDLKIVFCIGETKEEKSRRKTYQVLEKQIAKIFNELTEKEMQKIIIAYEPIWAIGGGIPAKESDIEEITVFIKKLIMDYYGVNIKILYGGSVNSENISTIGKIKSVDGFLVGSASLNAKEVSKMLQIANEL